MIKLPFITSFNKTNFQSCLEKFPDLSLIHHETRQDFSADFPLHNRYFSNGDKPYVALVKTRGHVELIYDNAPHSLVDNEFVFFDDNIRHSWIMRNCDLEIFYYKQVVEQNERIFTGDYCLDDFFQ